MLYLPLGIRNFLTKKALDRQVNYGRFLVEVASDWAWAHGYTCDHPENMIQRDKDRSSDTNRNIWRCRVCGICFEREVKTRRLKKIGYMSMVKKS